MRTVAVKTVAQKAQAMLFRTRTLLVGERTQIVIVPRGNHCAHGIVIGREIGNVARLASELEAADVPGLVKEMAALARSTAEIGTLDHHTGPRHP